MNSSKIIQMCSLFFVCFFVCILILVHYIHEYCTKMSSFYVKNRGRNTENVTFISIVNCCEEEEETRL